MSCLIGYRIYVALSQITRLFVYKHDRGLQFIFRDFSYYIFTVFGFIIFCFYGPIPTPTLSDKSMSRRERNGFGLFILFTFIFSFSCLTYRTCFLIILMQWERCISRSPVRHRRHCFLFFYRFSCWCFFNIYLFIYLFRTHISVIALNL